MNQIAWIGLGNMGAPMAKNLAAKGYSVIAYNRSPKSVDCGDCKRANTLQGTVEGADIVFLMLSDGEATRNVLFDSEGALTWLRPGTLVVNMSTIGVDETKQIALRLAEHGIEYMDAPVSGSVGPAQNGTLVVLAGGTESAFERVEPLFQAMAKSAHHLGDVGSGATMKLLVNTYLGMVVQGVSECMAVADKSGVGRGALLDILSETAMWSPIVAGKQKLWRDDEYPAAFALKHMTKDLGLMADFATQLSASMPGLLSVLGVYLSAQAKGMAELDMAAVAKQMNQLVGLS